MLTRYSFTIHRLARIKLCPEHMPRNRDYLSIRARVSEVFSLADANTNK